LGALAVPLWNESADSAGTPSYVGRLPCITGYDNACDLVPAHATGSSSTSRYFAKYVDQSPDHPDVEGIAS